MLSRASHTCAPQPSNSSQPLKTPPLHTLADDDSTQPLKTPPVPLPHHLTCLVAEGDHVGPRQWSCGPPCTLRPALHAHRFGDVHRLICGHPSARRLAPASGPIPPPPPPPPSTSPSSTLPPAPAAAAASSTRAHGGAARLPRRKRRPQQHACGKAGAASGKRRVGAPR